MGALTPRQRLTLERYARAHARTGKPVSVELLGSRAAVLRLGQEGRLRIEDRPGPRGGRHLFASPADELAAAAAAAAYRQAADTAAAATSRADAYYALLELLETDPRLAAIREPEASRALELANEHFVAGEALVTIAEDLVADPDPPVTMTVTFEEAMAALNEWIDGVYIGEDRAIDILDQLPDGPEPVPDGEGEG